MPKTIGIAIVTWPRSIERIKYFSRTVRSLVNLLAPKHHLVIWASAEHEGVDIDNEGSFCATARRLAVPWFWRTEPANLGANMNRALQIPTDPAINFNEISQFPVDYLLLLQDDWHLLEPLDLSPYCDFLDSCPDYALVRFSWPEVPEGDERSHWIKWQKEEPTPGFIVTRKNPHPGPIYALDNSSTFLYGDQPHLRRANYLEQIGPYKEGGDTGEPEVDMCGRLKERGLQVATSERVVFHHIGVVSSLTSHAERFKPT